MLKRGRACLTDRLPGATNVILVYKRAVLVCLLYMNPQYHAPSLKLGVSSNNDVQIWCVRVRVQFYL